MKIGVEGGWIGYRIVCKQKRGVSRQGRGCNGGGKRVVKVTAVFGWMSQGFVGDEPR